MHCAAVNVQMDSMILGAEKLPGFLQQHKSGRC